MGAVIRWHNNTILANKQPALTDDNSTKTCNCRKKADCPLNRKCLTQCVVYKATVNTTNENDEKEYIGLTANTFKQRFNNHQQSFRHKKYENSTALSKHIWSLKAAEKPYSIEWTVHRKAAAYTNRTKRCNLCLAEKVAVIQADGMQTLNKRSELVSKCRHENKFYQANFVPDVT